MGMLRTHKSWILGGFLALFVALSAGVALADATPPAPDLAQRVADLEAYLNNGAPKVNTTTPGRQPQGRHVIVA